jgi:hypothetical protein
LGGSEARPFAQPQLEIKRANETTGTRDFIAKRPPKEWR